MSFDVEYEGFETFANNIAPGRSGVVVRQF